MKTILYNDDKTKKNVIESDELYSIENHFDYIELIYNNDVFIYNTYINKELKKKYNSYIQQDKYKNKYDVEKHITYKQLIEKLYDSKLICYYCNNRVYLIYKDKVNRKQWSLERFDNNIGHYNTNTCISCLDCNLKRRTGNHEYYKKFKSIVIKKV